MNLIFIFYKLSNFLNYIIKLSYILFLYNLMKFIIF